MYAFFAAEGRVLSVDEKTSKKGTTFTVLLLDVSDGKYGHELEVTAFHGAAEYAGGLRKGDLVAVSGRLESPMNQSGYRNARVTAGTVVKVGGEQPAPQPEQQSFTASAPTPATPASAVYDEDIPF